MWADLLPKIVGGVLTDHDAPNHPTKIVDFELTETTVAIIGEDFTFGGARQYYGLTNGIEPRTLVMRGPLMAATITFPEAT